MNENEFMGKIYNDYPVKKDNLTNGPEFFSEQTDNSEREKRIAELEAKLKEYENYTEEECLNILNKAKEDLLEKLQNEGIPETVKLVCPNCKKYRDSKFCPDCGTKTVFSAYVKCAECGFKYDMNLKIGKFCPDCGKRFDADSICFEEVFG